MPTVLKAYSLAAGASVELLSGTEYEYPINARRGNTYTIAGTCDGVTASVTTLSFSAGQRSILADGPLTVAASANANPKLNEDLITSGHVMPGERARVTVKNEDSGTRAGRVLIDISG